MNKVFAKYVMFLAMMTLSYSCFAAADTIGGVATTLTGNFESLAKLVTAGAYLAGMGFSVGAILKFKQHKDNPTQIPVGTPVAMLFVAAALLFLPSIMKVAGYSIFGKDGIKAGGVGGVSEFLDD